MARPMDWQGAVGLEWAYKHRMYDRLLRPIGETAMEALGDVTGKRVLDIGCGAGATTLDLSARGAIPTGVDISEAQIDVARTQDTEFRCTFVVGDAGEVEYVRRFDALYSRTGTIFFKDPVRTFRHLRAYTRNNGAMVLTFWNSAAENAWSEVPSNAATSVLGRDTSGSRNGPYGPFAWAEEEVFRKILRESGWRNTTSKVIQPMIEISDPTADDPIESAAQLCAAIILRRRLGECSERERAAVMSVLRKDLANHLVDGKVQLGGSAWLVHTSA